MGDDRQLEEHATLQHANQTNLTGAGSLVRFTGCGVSG